MKFYNLSLLLSLLAVLYSGPAFAKKIEVNGLKVKVSYFRKRAAVLGPQNKDSFTVDSLFVPDFSIIMGVNTRPHQLVDSTHVILLFTYRYHLLAK